MGLGYMTVEAVLDERDIETFAIVRSNQGEPGDVAFEIVKVAAEHIMPDGLPVVQSDRSDVVRPCEQAGGLNVQIGDSVTELWE